MQQKRYLFVIQLCIKKRLKVQHKSEYNDETEQLHTNIS